MSRAVPYKAAELNFGAHMCDSQYTSNILARHAHPSPFANGKENQSCWILISYQTN
jgi:hypothetical protein